MIGVIYIAIPLRPNQDWQAPLQCFSKIMSLEASHLIKKVLFLANSHMMLAMMISSHLKISDFLKKPF